VGQFFGAWDPAAFRPIEDYRADVDRMVATLRAAEPAEGFDRVYVPGDQEFAAEAERRRDGIPLHPKVVEELETLARSCKLRLDAAL
jgi:LDH2 family malate/lactate/ureidoglycolate dehydrogenase